jgi:hypothetical protein
MKAEDKLRLCTHEVVLGYLGSHIAVDFDNFQLLVSIRELIDMLIGKFAVRVPLRPEINHNERETINRQVLIEQFHLIELLNTAESRPD